MNRRTTPLLAIFCCAALWVFGHAWTTLRHLSNEEGHFVKKRWLVRNEKFLTPKKDGAVEFTVPSRISKPESSAINHDHTHKPEAHAAGNGESNEIKHEGHADGHADGHAEDHGELGEDEVARMYEKHDVAGAASAPGDEAAGHAITHRLEAANDEKEKHSVDTTPKPEVTVREDKGKAAHNDVGHHDVENHGTEVDFARLADHEYFQRVHEDDDHHNGQLANPETKHTPQLASPEGGASFASPQPPRALGAGTATPRSASAEVVTQAGQQVLDSIDEAHENHLASSGDAKTFRTIAEAINIQKSTEGGAGVSGVPPHSTAVHSAIERSTSQNIVHPLADLEMSVARSEE
eukprot:Selendium_serpulae@DN3738_c0_g1_i1.p1